MSLRINDIAPDFTADSTAGQIKFHDWVGDVDVQLPYLRTVKAPA